MIKTVLRKMGTERERLVRLSKEGSWIVVGQIASVAGMLVLVRVLTEFLTPLQYGQLTLALTVAGFVTQVVMGGITVGIGRFYSIASESNDLSGYLNDSVRLMAYATAAVVVVGMIMVICLYWLDYSEWAGLTSIVLIFSVLNGYNASLNNVQNAARQRAIVAVHSGLNAWLKIGLAVCALLWLGVSSIIVVIGYIFATLLVTLSQLYFFQRTVLKKASMSTKQRLWKSGIWQYSWPFSLFGIFTWMQQVSDRWSLQAFSTTEDVGRYAVVLQLGYTPIAMLLGMAMTFIGPILYQRSGDATDDMRNKDVHHLSWRVTTTALIVTGVTFIVTLIMHEWIFRILVAPEYRGISYLLPWVILAGGLFAGGQMISLKLMSEMKTRALIIPKIITAMLGIGLNILGAALAGIHGVVIALIIFSTIYYIWMLMLGYYLPSPMKHLIRET